jgi:hypothetical protein
MAEEHAYEGVRLAGTPTNTLWDIKCNGRYISGIKKHDDLKRADGRLVTPSLCHPHIHLDKRFLLFHPKYSDLEIRKGDFAEAMDLTGRLLFSFLFILYISSSSLLDSEIGELGSQPCPPYRHLGTESMIGQAKSRFQHDDLLERGRVLIEESINYGVTHMQAFVEVDRLVGLKCLDAGLALKREFKDICVIQICAFAQDPIYSQGNGVNEMFALMQRAAAQEDVDVVGSTPYVENSVAHQKANIEWMVALAVKHDLHLDFHLDYNIDPQNEPAVHHVIQTLQILKRPSQRAVTLGHCTRLTLFNPNEWKQFYNSIGDLPIAFIGLPTSDLFMMGRPDENSGGGERPRGTLQIPQMIRIYNIQGALGINNVGNAFTPQGSCDPLSVASLGVGVYQAGTKEDTEILFVSLTQLKLVPIHLVGTQL